VDGGEFGRATKLSTKRYVRAAMLTIVQATIKSTNTMPYLSETHPASLSSVELNGMRPEPMVSRAIVLNVNNSGTTPDETVEIPAIFQRIDSAVLRKWYRHAIKCSPP
jgi:hypothetical protein